MYTIAPFVNEFFYYPNVEGSDLEILIDYLEGYYYGFDVNFESDFGFGVEDDRNYKEYIDLDHFEEFNQENDLISDLDQFNFIKNLNNQNNNNNNNNNNINNNIENNLNNKKNKEKEEKEKYLYRNENKIGKGMAEGGSHWAYSTNDINQNGIYDIVVSAYDAQTLFPIFKELFPNSRYIPRLYPTPYNTSTCLSAFIQSFFPCSSSCPC